MTARPRNLSEDEFAALVAKRDRDAIERVRSTAATGRAVMDSTQSHDRIARPGASASASSPYRSKLEAAFAEKLAFEKQIQLLSYVAYEPLNLRLPGNRNFWKPDFLVRDKVGTLIFYEVKGHNLSDDRSLVKMKVAAAITPWARFVLVKRIQGAWEERIIS